MVVKLPLGIDSFKKIRSENYYYIDKTLFIRELLEHPYQVNLITRPRRFGKTLAMSMLADFFDLQEQSAERFEGLAVGRERELCEKLLSDGMEQIVLYGIACHKKHCKVICRKYMG